MSKNLFFSVFCILTVFVTIVFGSLVEPLVYFSSEIDLSKKFIEQIEKEPKKIRMATERLSDVEVIQALIKAHKRGVSIEIIVDPITVTRRSPLSLLVDEGISVYVWNSDQEVLKAKKKEPKRGMHHVFSVFGSGVSWTGSYSFSLKRLFSHRESALVLQDEKVSSAYLLEFERMKIANSILFVACLEKKKI